MRRRESAWIPPHIDNDEKYLRPSFAFLREGVLREVGNFAAPKFLVSRTGIFDIGAGTPEIRIGISTPTPIVAGFFIRGT